MRDLEAVTALRLALLREESGNPLFAHPHPDASARALRLTRTPLVTGSRQAIVTTAYVIPGARRGGVLRALLAAADRWCRQRRLSGMRLHCGLANAAGRQAWESLGFGAAELLYVRSIPAD